MEVEFGDESSERVYVERVCVERGPGMVESACAEAMLRITEQQKKLPKKERTEVWPVAVTYITDFEA